MKNICRAAAILVLPVFLLLPRIDAVFSATMPRKALLEPLLLLLWGWAASRLLPRRRTASHAPSAVVAATFILLFWMIPRSIDMTQIFPVANALYLICLVAAGFLLARYLPLLPGVVRVTFALYLASMMAAFGLLYASQSTLLCSAFTLQDQHAFGWMLVALGLVAYLIVLCSMPRWLVPARESR